MKIAVINEGSTKHRNVDVLKALDGFGHEVYNLGMKNIDGEPDLTYIETSFLSALALNLKAVDFVIGGCGSGQGYMNGVLQYPGVAAGLLVDLVDVYLFSQVNAGNCLSLALNKGYGLGGDLNLRFMMQQLFSEPFGGGYPAARKEIQAGARRRLTQLSVDTHKSMQEIISVIDRTIIQRSLGFPGVLDFIKAAPASELKDCVLNLKF
jgi:ribose 5-phosphate isomerase RpiB